MPLKSSVLSETPTTLRKRSLPRINNRQFHELEEEAKKRHYKLGFKLNRCPTCKSKPLETTPKVVWPDDSTYRYLGETHHCDCDWQDALRRRYIVAHIPQGYWRLSRHDWWGDAEALGVAEDYLANWEGNADQGIGVEFFSPTTGTGKTFLATFIARHLIQRGEAVYYTRFDEIMGLYNRSSEEQQRIEDYLRYSPVLVLDEVRSPISGGQGDYFAMEFEVLMRSRIDDDRVTVMTTNLTPERLEEYYPRIYSLLAAKQIRHEVKFYDARKRGEVHAINTYLAKEGEARPIC